MWTKNKEMMIPAEIEFKMNVTESVTKLQRLAEAASKAVSAIDDFNIALERCKKMDLEISINYKSNTKKWWQIWK
jgi:hypothetical protein